MNKRGSVRSRARRTVRGLPRLMRVGFGIVVVGAAIDLGYHFGTGAPGMGHGPVALTGHLLTLIGMLITMLGLLWAAWIRRPQATRPERRI